MKKLILTITALLIPCLGHAIDAAHHNLTLVMNEFNKSGLINYQSLKTNPALLTFYLDELKQTTQLEFDSYNEDEKTAFWINAYNAFTLKAIVDNYPIKASFLKSALYPKNSIRQISGVWDKLQFETLGKNFTLNQIEHEILRKNFNEPRIHMALVCAALSCPPLRSEAYTGEDLNNQLNDQAKSFLTNPSTFLIDTQKSQLSLSPIFDWFGDDFIKTYSQTQKFANLPEKERAVMNFIINYLSPAQQQFLSQADLTIEYLKYDWTLNEQ